MFQLDTSISIFYSRREAPTLATLISEINHCHSGDDELAASRTMGASMSGDITDFTELYDLMPRQKIRTIWNIPVIWFKDLSDRKVAVDALSLLVKSLPGIVIIASTIIIAILFYSYSSIRHLYSAEPHILYIVSAIFLSITITYGINYVINRRLMKKLRNLDHPRDFDF